MRILVDECVPRPIRRALPGHDVLTAQQAGFGGYKNGRLLKAAEDTFDLLITADKNLHYQQNLTDRKLAILLLSTNDMDLILANRDQILETVNHMKHAEFRELFL